MTKTGQQGLKLAIGKLLPERTAMATLPSSGRQKIVDPSTLEITAGFGRSVSKIDTCLTLPAKRGGRDS